MKRAHAFAVEAEVLRRGGRGEEVEAACGEHADRLGVLVDAAGKALIGHVEKREVALPFKNVADALPDLAREVAPRGVVGAGVHENEGRLLERFERGDERLGRGVARRAVQSGINSSDSEYSPAV